MLRKPTSPQEMMSLKQQKMDILMRKFSSGTYAGSGCCDCAFSAFVLAQLRALWSWPNTCEHYTHCVLCLRSPHASTPGAFREYICLMWYKVSAYRSPALNINMGSMGFKWFKMALMNVTMAAKGNVIWVSLQVSFGLHK